MSWERDKDQESRPGEEAPSAIDSARPGWLVPLLFGIGLIGLAVVGWLLPVAEWVRRFEITLQAWGASGAAVFTLVYAICTVLLVPGSALTLIAGGLYGVVRGTIIISAGSTLGAVLALVIARSSVRPVVERWAARRPRFRMIDRAVARQGAWIVFLLRLSPIFPFNLLNYALGLTSIGIIPYTVASWVGMLPGTVAYVVAGKAGLVALTGGAGATLWILAAVATLWASWLITRITVDAVRRAGAEEDRPPVPRTVADAHELQRE